MTAVASAFRRSPALPRGFAHEGPLYLLPAGIAGGEAGAAAVIGGGGWPLGGGDLAFTAAAVLWREGGETWIATAPFAEVIAWAEEEPAGAAILRLIHRVGEQRPDWAGLPAERPLIMGIVNVTPDSFSDGGDAFDAATAVVAGLSMVEAGADIIDVGGESTRPGAEPVSLDEELARVLPVVRRLAEAGVAVSIDTRHAAVMTAAVAAGARIINDVGALRAEGALEAAAKSGAAVCLMHMQGEPKTMQEAPHYACAPLDVYDFLAERVAACEAAGIPRERLAVDPGIGFGKTAEHNAQVLAALPLYHGLGCPLLLGASRKSFIANLSADEAPRKRLPGSLAAAVVGLEAGAHILRVHDVVDTVQAVKVWRAVKCGG
jgi:dihydropteroate synthase